MGPTLQHNELDHTDHTHHTDQGYIFPLDHRVEIEYLIEVSTIYRWLT